MILKAIAFSLLVLPSSAISFVSWFRPWLIDPRDKNRTDFWCGIASPQMDEHWARFRQQWWNPHVWNNIGSEWARLDAQRAFKFMAAHILLYVIIAGVLAWLMR